MSALPDVPDDFLRWARIHFDAGLIERSFPPRAVYGAYVGDLLEKTVVKCGLERFYWLQDRALSLRRRGSGFAVQREHGPEVQARAVVLATGNFPPGNPAVRGLQLSMPCYFPFPWSPDALEDLPENGMVLLLGSGPTSVDLIVALKSKGFGGTIEVLSRKGIFPHACRQLRPAESWPMFWNEQCPQTVHGLLRLIRDQVCAASETGVDWRAVIDSLRLLTRRIWQSLPIAEKRRFLRHVRPYWDVHRHRVAPEIADLLADMRAEGQAGSSAYRSAYRDSLTCQWR